MVFCEFNELLDPECTVESLGSRGGLTGADVCSQFRFNSSIKMLEEADFCLLVGTNLPAQGPLLQTRLRKAFLHGTIDVCAVGRPQDISFPIAQAGITAGALVEIAEGRHAVCAQLAQAKRPVIVVSAEVFEREDGRALAAAVDAIADASGNVRQYDASGALAWNGVSVLHGHANDVGLLEMGCTKPFAGAPAQAEPKPDLLFMLGVGANELPAPLEDLVGKDTLIVVQNSHGDELTSCADVVLPGAAFSEKSGVYVNVEGRAQKARAAASPPVGARHDWKVLRALSELCDMPTLPYESDKSVDDRLLQLLPTMERRGQLPAASSPKALFGPAFARDCAKVLGKGVVYDTPLKPPVYDFFLEGTAVAASSAMMAKASSELGSLEPNFLPLRV